MVAVDGCVALARRSPGAPAVSARRAAGTGIAALVLGVASTGFYVFGTVGLVVLAAVLGLVAPLASGRFRGVLRDHEARRAKRARRAARDRTLSGSLFGRATLGDLTHLADDIERADPRRDDDLEELLDRYAMLTAAHERAVRATTMSDRAQLERMRDGDLGDDPRRRELCTRRLHCLDDCEATVATLELELALVADTIRLLAQRAMCPEIPPRSEAVARQLAELDDAEAVRRECALLCEPELVPRHVSSHRLPPPRHVRARAALRR